MLVTEPSDVRQVFAILFSTNADSVGESGEINMENKKENYMMYLKNYNSILKVKEHHRNVHRLNLKPVSAFYVDCF